MKPSARVWRKAAKASAKGAAGGRRNTHKALIQPPRRSSTWLRRHPGEIGYWLRNAGRRQLLDGTIQQGDDRG